MFGFAVLVIFYIDFFFCFVLFFVFCDEKNLFFGSVLVCDFLTGQSIFKSKTHVHSRFDMAY